MTYQPHSTTTQLAYEEFLRDVRRWVPPGLDSVLSFAEELIDLIQQGKRGGGQHVRDDIQGHFGRPIPNDAVHRLVERALLLTDFVGASAAHRNESDDDELLSSAGNESSSSDEADEGLRDTVDSSIGDDEDDNLHYQRIPFVDVAGNPRYLLEALRRLFPSSTPAECQGHETKVLNFLRERSSDAGVVETQLTACLGAYDDESIAEWITSAVESRWTLVYGLAFANAGRQVEKDRVIAALLEHSKSDRDAEALYVEITGRDIGGGHSGSRGDDDDSAASDDFTSQMKTIDIRGLQFADERSPFRSSKVVVPRGVQYETHQEIVLPPSELFRGEVKKTPLTEFPDWARPVFPDYMTSLNRMQSIVHPCAFSTNENMLVCAPTGAGKTNVAMMAILRCLSTVYRPATGTFDTSQLKMVYVAPMKALVQEVVQTFSKRLEPLGISVAELSGDASLSKQQLAETQLIVTTPEKWDVVTRKSMDLGVASLVRLIIIDEIHLLHNDRGPVLEAIVARFKLQSRQQQHQGGGNAAATHGHGPTRFVGLSATLPNYEDVASFMRVDRNKGLFHFDASFREVPLRQTYCQTFKVKGMNSAEVLNTVAYKKAMEHAHHEQVMVFVHSRKDTEFTAQFMLQKARFENIADSIMRPGSDSERAVHAAISELEDTKGSGTVREALKQLLPRGFAVHHAGMSREERALVEELFLHRHLKVLVCTSTLAWGVNLPANAVVVKGTQVFSAEKGGTTLLSVLDVLQMFGRAGRVGFGSALGEACIITNTAEDLSYYLGALNQQLPIESRFLDRVIDALNAEVVLGSVRSIADAAEWLQCTYFYVRMRQHPQLYGTKGPTSKDPMCLQHIFNVVHTAAQHLHSSKLVEYDQHTKSIRATELGRIASHYYLVHESMRTYQQHMWEGMHETDLFQLFSLSHEFRHISVRPDEGAQLRELLACCPIAVSDGPTTTAAKVNVLLQCFISNMNLVGLPLMSELVYIKDSAQRILRALYDIALERGFGLTARSVLRMFLMVVHRQWVVQSPLRQVRRLMASQTFSEIVDTLESRRVDWTTLQTLSLEDLQALLKRDRTAEVAHEMVRKVPRYTLQVAARPLTQKMLSIDIDVTPFYNYDDELHNTSRELLLTIEHNNGTILHHESIFLPRDRLQYATDDGASGPVVQMTIGVPLVDPKPCYYFVRCLSPSWIGCESVVPVSLLDTSVPAPKLPNIEVGDIPTANTNGGDEEDDDALLVEKILKPYHLDEVGSKFFGFQSFTKLQGNVLEAIFADEAPDIFAGVPMGAGKTTLAELFALRYILDRSTAVPSQLLYITATNTVAARRFEEWSFKFQELLDGSDGVPPIVHLTAAAAHEEHIGQRLAGAAIIVTSPDGITPLLRRGGEGLHGVTYMIIDHAHLLRDARLRAFECSVSRLLSAPYLLNGGARRPRLLALSLPTANCEDVCRWLKIKVAFNYGKSFWRFQTQLIGCEVGGYHNRYAQATLSAVRGIVASQVGASKLVFVPSAKGALEFADQLITARKKDPANVFDVAIPSDITDELDDKEASTLLSKHAIGLITSRSTLGDIALQLHFVESPPTSASSGSAVGVTIIATFESAWRLPAAVFDQCVVCLPERSVGSASSTESDELAAQLHADCSISETLQMVSRGRIGCTVYCRRAQRWMLHQYLNEPLPVESCNRDAYDFRETINAAIAQRYVHTMNDVLSVLKTHYIFQHLKGNPSFHGLSHDSERPRHLSVIAGRAVLSLAHDLKCIDYDEQTLTVKPLARGMAAAFHCMSMDTMELFESGEVSSEAMATPGAVLLGVCKAEEIALGSLRDGSGVRRHEAAALQVAARTLRSSFDVQYLNLDYSASHTKAYLLTLMRCARLKWSALSEHVYGAGSPEEVAPASVLAQLDADTEVVAPVVLQVLRSAVELISRREVVCVQNIMCLVQCIQRRVWIDDADVLQLTTLQKFPDMLASWDSAHTLAALSTAATDAAASSSGLTGSAVVAGWAARWRPQLSSEKQLQKKAEVLAGLLTEDIANIPQLSSLTARAELQEVSDGNFVCVVTVNSTVTYFSETQQRPGAAPEEAWVSIECGSKDGSAAQKILGVRTAWYHYNAASASNVLAARIMFPLEDIEDDENVSMRARVALTSWRVMGDSAVPME